MNAGIVYATKTKHSQKLAEVIGERLKLTPENVSQSSAPSGADLLFIVGGIYGGESLPALLDYVRGLDASHVKRAALVTNCGGGSQRQASVRRILEEKGICIVGEFVCRGAILFVSAGHPSSKDLKAAADFAESIVGSGV